MSAVGVEWKRRGTAQHSTALVVSSCPRVPTQEEIRMETHMQNSSKLRSKGHHLRGGYVQSPTQAKRQLCGVTGSCYSHTR